MGAIADVVPNHVAVPTPARLNKALWSVLRDGPSSPYAEWFDVDWGSGNQPLLMAVLGQRMGKVLADGELSRRRRRTARTTTTSSRSGLGPSTCRSRSW